MANNLYEYYTGQGKALPSVADRQSIASSAGIKNYTGDANQNATLLNYLQKPSTTTTLSNGGATSGATVVNPVTITTPTGTYESPETIAARKAIEDSFNNPIDSNKIYQDTLTRFQSQIDNLNSVYANQLQQAKQIGAGRLGTTSAISARTGNLGSDFGNAQYQNQEQGNVNMYKAIDDERLSKINDLMNQAKTESQTAYKEKQDAFKQLGTRLEYYQNSDQRKVDSIGKALKSIIAQKLDPSNIDNSSLTKFANYYGITPEDIKSGYAEAKKASDEALVKANPAFELSAGQTRNVFNPKTGKYEVVASAPFKPTANNTPNVNTNIQAEKILDASRGTDNYVDPAVYQQAYEAFPGTLKQFLLAFPAEKYVNPVNKTLPEYLRPTVKTNLPSGSTKRTA